jgi:hypothetical protein
VLYQISVVNTTAAPIQVSLEDVLPSAFRYVEHVDGPEATVSGNTLRWNDITIQAAQDRPTVVRIKFRAQLTGGVAGRAYENAVRVTDSSVPFDTTYSSVAVTAADEVFPVFLPLAIR